MRVAVIGLGEAGRVFAAGFAARGASVVAFDVSAPAEPPECVELAADAHGAATGADVVVSLVGAAAAEAVADELLPVLAQGAVFADFNTAAPAVKVALAERAAAQRALFADVAVLAPARRAGVGTPLIASGEGAAELVARFSEIGVPIEVVGERAGDAAGLKLLRSVFMKGLAGIVFESLTAAERTGDTAWLRAQIAAELGPGGEPLVEHLIDGTRRHARRREHEMRDVKGYLAELGVPSWMTDGAIRWLREVGERE
jgi:3-hydroxyisobutyrate dehydrogenase-like beta-hydroxyacid dehydrogenase